MLKFKTPVLVCITPILRRKPNTIFWLDKPNAGIDASYLLIRQRSIKPLSAKET